MYFFTGLNFQMQGIPFSLPQGSKNEENIVYLPNPGNIMYPHKSIVRLLDFCSQDYEGPNAKVIDTLCGKWLH
jgi:hypothetical protein